MELSKKVGYIKGLMAGLNISDTTPEGKVLHAMSDLLEEMADEIETNAQLIDELGMFIDDLDEYADVLDDDLEDLDDIPVEVFDSDPTEGGATADNAFAAEDMPANTDELVEGDRLEDLTGLDELEQTELAPETPAEETAEAPAPEPSASEPEPAPAPSAEERYECQCPECGAVIGISAADMARGIIFCGNCGIKLQLG